MGDNPFEYGLIKRGKESIKSKHPLPLFPGLHGFAQAFPPFHGGLKRVKS